MLGIRVRENEGLDSAVRRFKRAVEKSGKLSEMRRREFFEPPSERKKRAKAAAVKRFRKKLLREGRTERDFGRRAPAAAKRPVRGQQSGSGGFGGFQGRRDKD